MIISSGPKHAPPSRHLVIHIRATRRHEMVRECDGEAGGAGGRDHGGGGGAVREGLQVFRPSSVDQHFLRDLQGPVG